MAFVPLRIRCGWRHILIRMAAVRSLRIYEAHRLGVWYFAVSAAVPQLGCRNACAGFAAAPETPSATTQRTDNVN